MLFKLLSAVIGFLITLFSYTNFQNMILCGLPCASVLLKCKAVESEYRKKFILLNIFGVFFNAVISFGGLVCVILFFNEYLTPYLIGSAIALIAWFFNKEALIPDRVLEYLTNYKSFLALPEQFPDLNFGMKRTLIYNVVCDYLTNNFNSPATAVSYSSFKYSDEQIQAYTQRYNAAFLILKDYNSGEFRNVSLESDQMLVNYIFSIIPLCLGWCVFHNNKDKKEKTITEAFRFLDDLIESAPKELADEAAKLNSMKIFYNGLDKNMVNYKKEVIDPAYIIDRSKENYNKLLTDFLKYICEYCPDIKWYDGILEDFRHCMEE